jgi:ASC-1-like (ASCH) protein
MLTKEGLNNVIPNAKSIQEGVDVYYKFYNPKDEKIFGVIGIGIQVIQD